MLQAAGQASGQLRETKPKRLKNMAGEMGEGEGEERGEGERGRGREEGRGERERGRGRGEPYLNMCANNGTEPQRWPIVG